MKTTIPLVPIQIRLDDREVTAHLRFSKYAMLKIAEKLQRPGQQAIFQQTSAKKAGQMIDGLPPSQRLEFLAAMVWGGVLHEVELPYREILHNLDFTDEEQMLATIKAIVDAKKLASPPEQPDRPTQAPPRKTRGRGGSGKQSSGQSQPSGSESPGKSTSNSPTASSTVS